MRKMMKVAVIGSYMLLTSVIVGCAQLGLTPATNPSEDLAYAYSAVAAVRTTAAQELSQGVITVATAQKVLADTDTARVALDAGQAALAAGNTNGATTAIATATGLLNEVKALLPPPTAKGN